MSECIIIFIMYDYHSVVGDKPYSWAWTGSLFSPPLSSYFSCSSSSFQRKDWAPKKPLGEGDPQTLVGMGEWERQTSSQLASSSTF